MRNPNLTVTRIEQAPVGVEWYQVQDMIAEFRLWIVEYSPQTDKMTCTCERMWCAHQDATACEILDEYARQDQADRLAYARGQF